jgi:hypothetical protein
MAARRARDDVLAKARSYGSAQVGARVDGPSIVRSVGMHAVGKRHPARAGGFAAAFVVAACAATAPPPVVVPTSSALVTVPGARLEQFGASVRSLKEQVGRARAVSSADYAGIQMSLRELADAIQLLPRGAEVLATIVPADAIRDDALRVGSPVLDDPSRTAATKRALGTAAQTLDRVARGAYSQDRTMATELTNLARAVQSVDESRILEAQRTQVLDAFESAVALLERMEQADKSLSAAGGVRR